MDSKALLFIEKFKELMVLADSMTEEEFQLLRCGIDYLQLHEKYPQFIKLRR